MCSTDTLKGEAQNWWVNVINQGAPTTWSKFVKVFYKRYFPESARLQKVREFANLQQGDMTVNEYAAKFNSLIRFAQRIVQRERYRSLKFDEGLRDNIKSRVDTHQLRTFAQVQDVALIAERDIDKYKKDQQGKRPFDNKGNGQGSFKKPFTKGSGSRSQASDKSHLLCSICNRYHKGVCYQTMMCNVCRQKGHIAKFCPQVRSQHSGGTNPDMRGKCFECGQLGHFARECPMKQQGISSMASTVARSGPNVNKGKGVEQRQGRSFQLTPCNV